MAAPRGRWARGMARLALAGHHPEERPAWERLAEVTVMLLRLIDEAGLHDHADVVSINMPYESTFETERRITTIARSGYDRLFTRQEDGTYRHMYGGKINHFDAVDGTDIDAAHDGAISITPLRMPRRRRPRRGASGRRELSVGRQELGQERRRPVRPRQDRHRPGAAGDRHVEDPPLLLQVVGQPAASSPRRRPTPRRGAIPPPSPVDRRQCHGGAGGRPDVQGRPEPRLEGVHLRGCGRAR